MPTPITFFVDRCLGSGLVVEAIRAGLLHGEHVHAHDALFPQDALDAEWLTEVGTKGWVVLTQDAAIRRRPNELGALLAARSAVFVFTTANLTGELAAQHARSALPAIRHAVARFDVPLLGAVNKNGDTFLRYIAGERVDPARAVKAPGTKRKKP